MKKSILEFSKFKTNLVLINDLFIEILNLGTSESIELKMINEYLEKIEIDLTKEEKVYLSKLYFILYKSLEKLGNVSIKELVHEYLFKYGNLFNYDREILNDFDLFLTESENSNLDEPYYLRKILVNYVYIKRIDIKDPYLNFHIRNLKKQKKTAPNNFSKKITLKELNYCLECGDSKQLNLDESKKRIICMSCGKIFEIGGEKK